MMDALLRYLVYFALGLLLVLVVAAVLFIPFTLLWNWLIPGIFGLREISFLEGFGLMVLMRMFFPALSIKNN